MESKTIKIEFTQEEIRILLVGMQTLSSEWDEVLNKMSGRVRAEVMDHYLGDLTPKHEKIIAKLKG